MTLIRVAISPRPYDVLLAHGLLHRAGEVLREIYPLNQPNSKSVRQADSKVSRRVFIVTTPTVKGFWGGKLVRSLKRSGFAVAVLVMPEGESRKRLTTVEKLAEEMVRLGADRSAVVIALGGGVVGDCAGFLASIYMRGVDVVQIPTTLLAQVDASIGGKTGVNLSAGKNLMGTFHQPRAVLIDPDVLATLPEREYRAGLFESLKCGILGSPALFGLFESELENIVRRDPATVEKIIRLSVELKAEIVAQDERESGVRMWLNLGHTIGHALEVAGNYRRYLHGEAVAWGLVASAEIARSLGHLSEPDWERIATAVFSVMRLPKMDADPRAILRRLQSDKKTLQRKVHFVLPTGIGSVQVVSGIPDAVVLAALKKLNGISG